MASLPLTCMPLLILTSQLLPLHLPPSVLMHHKPFLYNFSFSPKFSYIITYRPFPCILLMFPLFLFFSSSDIFCWVLIITVCLLVCFLSKQSKHFTLMPTPHKEALLHPLNFMDLSFLYLKLSENSGLSKSYCHFLDSDHDSWDVHNAICMALVLFIFCLAMSRKMLFVSMFIHCEHYCK